MCRHRMSDTSPTPTPSCLVSEALPTFFTVGIVLFTLYFSLYTGLHVRTLQEKTHSPSADSLL